VICYILFLKKCIVISDSMENADQVYSDQIYRAVVSSNHNHNSQHLHFASKTDKINAKIELHRKNCALTWCNNYATLRKIAIFWWVGRLPAYGALLCLCAWVCGISHILTFLRAVSRDGRMSDFYTRYNIDTIFSNITISAVSKTRRCPK